MHISIVSPVYEAQNIVEELVLRVTNETKKITADFEIILVEDGSKDASWASIESIAEKNKHVKGIKLSRNFGQHFAITAGLKQATGDYVIVMDCDLQDDPVYIPMLYQKITEGYEIVYTQKKKREHSVLKNISARLFFSLFNYLIDNKSSRTTGNVGAYSILSRKTVNAFLSFNDYRRHYLMVLRWLGFRYAVIDIIHQKRFEGKSSYNLKKLWAHALDGITSQSDKLLRLTVTIGFILSFIAFCFALSIIIRYFFKPFQPGWASLAVLISFVGGLVITSVGICGIYIGKTFEQTKNRPMFIVDKTVNIE